MFSYDIADDFEDTSESEAGDEDVSRSRAAGDMRGVENEYDDFEDSARDEGERDLTKGNQEDIAGYTHEWQEGMAREAEHGYSPFSDDSLQEASPKVADHGYGRHNGSPQEDRSPGSPDCSYSQHSEYSYGYKHRDGSHEDASPRESERSSSRLSRYSREERSEEMWRVNYERSYSSRSNDSFDGTLRNMYARSDSRHSHDEASDSEADLIHSRPRYTERSCSQSSVRSQESSPYAILYEDSQDKLSRKSLNDADYGAELSDDEDYAQGGSEWEHDSTEDYHPRDFLALGDEHKIKQYVLSIYERLLICKPERSRQHKAREHAGVEEPALVLRDTWAENLEFPGLDVALADLSGDEDEVAAIIASARAAAIGDRRPGRAGTYEETDGLSVEGGRPGRPTRRPQDMQWEEREVSAAVSTAARDAVEFGPVGSPPPDGDVCNGPGWVRDAGVQCGGSGIRNSNTSDASATRQGGVFSPAHTGGWPTLWADFTLQERGVQTDLSGSTPAMLRRNNSDVRLSIVSNPLATVKEDGPTESDSPTLPHMSERKYPERPQGAPPQHRRPAPGGGQAAAGGLSDSHLSLQQARSEFWEQGSTLGHQLAGSLAFGRRLDSRFFLPGEVRAAQAPMSRCETQDRQELDQQVSQLPAPVPSGHLHRLHDPVVRQGRRYYLQCQARAEKRKFAGQKPVSSCFSGQGPSPANLFLAGLEAQDPEAVPVAWTVGSASTHGLTHQTWQAGPSKKRSVIASVSLYSTPKNLVTKSFGYVSRLSLGKRF